MCQSSITYVWGCRMEGFFLGVVVRYVLFLCLFVFEGGERDDHRVAFLYGCVYISRYLGCLSFVREVEMS